jgi:hypothetical protein
LKDSSLKNLNKALGVMIESSSVGDFKILEEDGLSEFELLPTTPEPKVAWLGIPSETAPSRANVDEKYIPQTTLSEKVTKIVETNQKYFDLKFLINTLYESHRPGKTIKTIFSVGIVQMTLTSVWYNPILAAGFAAYLGYVYIQDSAKPELKFQNSKATLGAGALLFNNISPFIFDPAQSPFLFMTYLYFSVSAWSVLTSSLEKTKLLSKITYLTGANAFAIESPFVYLGVLTLLQKSYLDDIIQKNLPTIVVSNFLPTIKTNARQASIDYLVTVSDILQDSFKTVIYLPYKMLTTPEFLSMTKS